jgi:hypothetical protein
VPGKRTAMLMRCSVGLADEAAAEGALTKTLI